MRRRGAARASAGEALLFTTMALAGCAPNHHYAPFAQMVAEAEMRELDVEAVQRATDATEAPVVFVQIPLPAGPTEQS